MKHLTIPPEIRPLYKRAAYYVYEAVCGDCPEVEDYSLKARVEIVRDANHISMLGLSGFWKEEDRQRLSAWLKEHEYDEAYSRDMNRAVREAIGG